MRLDERGQTFVVRLVMRLQTGIVTRRIIHLQENFSVARTAKGTSSGRIMLFVPVFILERHSQMSSKCLPKFVQTDNASSRLLSD